MQEQLSENGANAGANGAAIGSGANAGASGTAIGDGATAGANGVALGAGTTVEPIEFFRWRRQIQQVAACCLH